MSNTSNDIESLAEQVVRKVLSQAQKYEMFPDETWDGEAVLGDCSVVWRAHGRRVRLTVGFEQFFVDHLYDEVLKAVEEWVIRQEHERQMKRLQVLRGKLIELGE